jgi:hypothetical protein
MPTVVGSERAVPAANCSGTRLAPTPRVAFRATLLGAWLALAAAGCGGIAEGRAPAPAPDPGEGETEPNDGGDKPSGDAPIQGDTELGDCKLGTLRPSSDPCPWVFDNRCYDTRDMACNCACPRSRDSLCLSGFESGAYGRVAVSCD